MRISILCYDLSSNALGRAFVLAQACPTGSRVTIWGPASSGRAWGPLARDTRFEFRFLEHRTWPPTRAEMSAWVGRVAAETDLVIACKPLGTSYGWGRALRTTHGKPLVLDVDDWELGFKLAGGVQWKIVLDGWLHAMDPLSYFPTKRLDAAARREPHVLVSNEVLQERFGGTLVPHARDEAWLDPTRWPQPESKRALGLEGVRVVLFFGTPRAHKGVEELVDAVARIRDEDVVCVLAGASPGDPYPRALERRAPGRVWLLGQEPFEDIPKVVAAADVVAVPQRGGIGTQGQVPAKLIDAMAMAKPIVSTSVDPIPRVLGPGAGLIVEPGRVEQLHAALERLLADPGAARAMGQRARARFLQEFSLRVARERVARVLAAAAPS